MTIAGLVLVAAFALAAIFITTRPVFSRGPVFGTPVRWDSLPVPVATRPQWATYSYAGPVNDLALTGRLLWAATGGGVVVWDMAGEDLSPVKFMVEHGLAANQAASLAVGLDGAVWVGTAGGLSRYDGRAWRTFTVEDGLPADSIRDLAVDREGYVWAATPSGLARYDGREWRTFSDRGVLASLPPGAVNSLAVDPANRLWVGTERGLARYDGRWTVFTAADGLPSEPVQKVVAGSSGDIWLSTPTGLKRFNGQVWDSFAPSLPGENTPLLDIQAFAPLADGTLLISPAGESSQLVRFDPAGNQTRIEADWWPDDQPAAAITSFLVDDQGAVWAGTGDRVARLGETSSVTLAAPSEFPSPEVNDLLLAQANLWLATAGGVARFDGSWRSFGLQEGLSDASTTRLATDENGAVWAAYRSPLSGLSRYDASADTWTTTACPVDAPAGLFIQQAAIGPDGNLWFATELGVSRYDGREWRAYTVRDGLSPGSVEALVVAQDGTVWAGTAAGLAMLAGDQWRVVDQRPVTDLAASAGSIWALSDGRLFQVVENRLTPMPDPPLSSSVRDLAATPDAVFLATADGVFRFHDGTWSIDTTADGLPSLDVTAIVADGERVWAATSSDSQQIDLVVFDGQAWRPHPNRVVAAEQLLSSLIQDVIRTPDGDMWLATPAGINRYRDGVWTGYTIDDGLPGQDVRSLAWAFESLWAATDLGLARFNGRTWEAFGATAHDQPGAGVQALVVGGGGELWVALEEGWPNGLRRFDGRGWANIPLRSATTTIRRMATGPSGELVVLVTDNGRSYLGLYDGQAWTWQDEAQWPLAIDQMAVDPAGRLWVAGRELDAGRPSPLIGVYELTAQGLGREIGRYTGPATNELEAGERWPGGSPAPFLFASDGRVYVGGAGSVYVFDSALTGDLQPVATLDIDLPFTRHTFALEAGEAGELWAGTERGVAILATRPDSPGGPPPRSYYAPARTPAWWGSARVLNVRPDGGVLVGTAAGGIGLYTGREFDGVLHPSQGPRSWARSFYPINAIVPVEVDNLWVGSAGGGAARFSGSFWELVAPDPALLSPVTGLALAGGDGWLGTNAGLVAISGLAKSLCRIEHIEPDLEVTAALRDGSGGLWAGTAGNGVIHNGGADDAFRQELGKAPVPALALAPNGELWFANGHQPWLTRYRPAAVAVAAGDEAWTRLPLQLGTVSPEMITALAIAPNLDIWLGTKEGLVRFSGGNWSRLTTRDGLADDHILDLLVTPEGEVWVATAGGLNRYSP